MADIPKYKRYGLQVGMGLDGQASGDLSDPFENMRMGLYATRMKYESAAVLTPYQILALHTYESAKTLNVEDRVGSLAKGKWADKYDSLFIPKIKYKKIKSSSDKYKKKSS